MRCASPECQCGEGQDDGEDEGDVLLGVAGMKDMDGDDGEGGGAETGCAFSLEQVAEPSDGENGGGADNGDGEARPPEAIGGFAEVEGAGDPQGGGDFVDEEAGMKEVPGVLAFKD